MTHALAVTTATRPTPPLRARARLVAGRCGCPYVERTGALPEGLFYVVERGAERVTDGRDRLTVDVGLLHAKVASGSAHPLIRAMGPATRVFDGTLGLAGDALHLAAALGAEVVASEAGPAVYSLAEAGLAGLAQGRWAEVAARIRPVFGHSAEVLPREGAFDAVFLAPMFEVAARAAPGWSLFRSLAVMGELDAATLVAARAAAPRVVVRVPKGARAPEITGWTAVPGGAVDYWVATR